ncbi:multiplied multi-transmembrane transporter-like protein [Babesia gibsoni]|uniref:Multiplied multi-transmembrane transporter-like protein n=1 Tax=Babesia gibsoni TaxID=33632 RepID=A0AAD8PF04_BABGI|nr:multiplied multi-transmembrane transporter-like protein [Babesia gibsoni]
MDAIDMEILPICMRAFEVSFGLSPATLSLVGAAEQGAVLLMSPLWGYLLGIKKPYQVESAAMLVCGMMCILLGTTTNYRMLVLATLIHGATLGCTGPTHQKIITSSVQKDERDMWYGIFTGVYYLAAMVSSILASRLSLHNVLGQYGWRLYYCVVGYMWLAAAVPTYYGMRPTGDDKNGGSPGQQQNGGNNGSEFWKGIGDLFTKPSYYFMISLIYVSESCELFMGYIVIYLQYCGVRNQMAGFAISVVHMGNMIAGFIGGYAIQKIHCASKDYGKLLTGIGLIAIRLFAITLLLRKPFQGGDMRWYHYMCLALFGFAQLNRTSIDRTMLSDFVKEDNAAIALSLCRVIAGIPSNFTFPPMIGYLAERAFGYITTDALVEDMDAFTKVTNATALSKSLLYIMGGSCLANMALYGGMMFTYRKDVDKLKETEEAKECSEASKETKAAGGGGGAASSESDKPSVTYPWYAKVLYHVYPAIDAFDMEILPICMRAFEVSFGLSPSSLSIVAACEQGAAFLLSPLWGFLLRYRKPYQIETPAMLVCGIMCIILGITRSYMMLVLATLVHGFVLGVTGPIHQKIITSSVNKDDRDFWYGIFTGVYYSGALLSSMLASRFSLRNVFGQYGWRFYYCAVGYMWLVAAVPTYFFMRPTGDDKNGGSKGPQQSGNNNGSIWQSIKRLFTINTYIFIITLTYVSESCELFMGYIVIYLQYCGVPNHRAGFAISAVHMGNMVAGFAGGHAVGLVHSKFNNYGKQFMGIAVVTIRMIAITLLLWRPFEGGNMRWHHYSCLLLFGVAMLNRSIIDRTIISDVVQEDDAAIALSLARAIAAIPSYFTFPPLIGYLTENVFGYIKTEELVEDMDRLTRITNATALSKSLLYIMGGSCLANMALYGGMIYTYSKDVVAKEDKANKECKKAEGGKEAGGGSGTANVGGDGGAPGSPGGSGSGLGSTGSGTKGGVSQANGHSQTAVSKSPKPESTPTEATVTVTATRVACEGTSISKKSDGSVIRASYVSCAASSQKASCMAVTGAMESSASGATGGSPNILATCVGATSTTESGTSAGTICGGIAVYKSKKSSSDDATTAIVACATADAERSSTSKDGGKSRLVIQECVGVAIRKTKEKGFVLAVGMRRKCAFSKTKSSTLPK